MKLDSRLTLRIASEDKQVLQEAARRRKRTTNWLAQQILQAWVARQKKKKSKSEY